MIYAALLAFAVWLAIPSHGYAQASPTAPAIDAVTEEDQRGLLLKYTDLLEYSKLRAGEHVFGETQIELMKISVFEEPLQTKFRSVVLASKNPAAQELVDKAALKIFSSKSALGIFCPYMPTAERVQLNFGVSLEAGQTLADSCAGVKHRTIDEDLQKFATKPSRQVVFIQTEQPSPVESWTSKRGDIYVFHTGVIEEFALIRALIHEYFVAYDALYMFHAKTAHHYFGLKKMPEEQLKAVEVYFNAFANPLIRGSFQMARALNFENIVLEEILGLKLKKDYKECWARVRAIGEQIIDRQYYFIPEHYDWMKPQVRLKTYGFSDMSAFDLILEAERLAKFKPSLCEMMSRPTIGSIGGYYTAGPRPRIGSGTEKRSDRLRSMNKKLQPSVDLSTVWPLSFNDSRLPKTQFDLNLMKATPLPPLVILRENQK